MGSPAINLTQSLTKHLPNQLLAALARASEESLRLGARLYLVGGAIRDLLLGRASVDIDLVCEGDATALGKYLSASLNVPLTIHARFQTVHLDLGPFAIDIASARRESYARPGALPTVQPGSMNDDLARRDFTINAMAINLTPAEYGILLDPYEGRNDLEHGFIRVLHSGSFVDDATRMWRAVRYEQRLAFLIEPVTLELLTRNLNMVDTLSPDRVRHELELILKEDCPEQTLGRATELGLLQKIQGGLRADDWLVVKYREARSLDLHSRLGEVYLCLLVYRLNQNDNEEVITRLNVPRRIAGAMRDTLHLKSNLRTLGNPAILPSFLYDELRRFVPQAIYSCLVASDLPQVKDNLYTFLKKLRRARTSLNGDDLIKIGVPPGPEVGALLHELHSARLDRRVKNRSGELELATDWLVSLKAGQASQKRSGAGSSTGQP